jgi:hypothetical protein
MPLRQLSFKSDARVALAVVAVAFVVYVATMYPDVPGGDSGELIGAVATGGIIHPPGYPLYAALGRLFLLVPHGSLAWRLNLFSAVCDALAAGALFVAVARWSRSRWGGLVAAGLFAFAPIVWMYAITAEVFALNNLFVALLILVAVRYDETRDKRVAYAGALTSGLALANHQTVLFVIAPLAVWMLWVGRRDLLRLRPLLALVALFAVGLLPYLLLLLGRQGDAMVSWGATRTWPGFLTHVLRREYGALHVVEGERGVTPAGTVATWAKDLVFQLGWWGVPLSLAGLFFSVRDREHERLGVAMAAPPVLAVGAFAMLWTLPSADPLHREILARFWQEPDMFVCAWCGWAIAELGRRARLLEPPLAGALALSAFAVNAKEMDHHTSRIVREYGAEILRAAPPNAVLLTKGDVITNTTRYLQLAERMRPDVRIVDQELLGYRWYARQIAEANRDIHLTAPRYAPGAPDGFVMKQLLDANYGQWPILICGGVKEGDLTADATYGRWPHGLCETVRRGSDGVDVDDWIAESEAALPRIAFGDESRPPGSWEDIAWGDYWQVRANRGIQLMTIAGADPERRPYLAEAEKIFRGIIEANPDVGASVYKDLVLAIGRQGLEMKGDRARQVAAIRSFLKVAPPDDPMLPGLERELARLSAE